MFTLYGRFCIYQFLTWNHGQISLYPTSIKCVVVIWRELMWGIYLCLQIRFIGDLHVLQKAAWEAHLRAAKSSGPFGFNRPFSHSNTGVIDDTDGCISFRCSSFCCYWYWRHEDDELINVGARTWWEAYEGAVGQGVVSVHFEVDGDGVEDGLQVLLLFKTTGGIWGRGGS